MTVSVLVPYTSGCEHRAAARAYVLDHYTQHHPDWELIEGACPDPWSKGAALADAYSRASGDVLVVADADSFTAPEILEEAVRIVDGWVVPHRKVHRLDSRQTLTVYNGTPPGHRSRDRHPYTGVQGGGITVLTRKAWDTVRGVDERFLGWGGEDIAFGWALETLVGPSVRLDGILWHLWHPPEIKGSRKRGSPESEALAGRYRDALHVPRLMRALVNRTDPPPAVPLVKPARFHAKAPGLIVRRDRAVLARFRRGEFTTTDPDVAAALRQHPRVQEVTA